MSIRKSVAHGMFALFGAMLVAVPQATAQQQKRPNVVMLMTDDTGWNDFGAYSGAAPPSAIRRRTSTGSPRKARCSPAGTVRRAARRAAPRS